jgi:hypothetical protein
VILAEAAPHVVGPLDSHKKYTASSGKVDPDHGGATAPGQRISDAIFDSSRCACFV